VNVPKDLRDRVKAELWRRADELEWDSLGSAEKAKHYGHWTESETIGRALSVHMDPRAVRVYIKDTLLKDYGRQKLNDHQALVLRLLEREETEILRSHIKPHGLTLRDGSMVAWGRADDWKVVLGALFERAFTHGDGGRTIVLFKAAPRYLGKSARALVEDAATRLGIDKCVWFD
jgi:hypothetical protein